jgi:hypothetical protein
MTLVSATDFLPAASLSITTALQFDSCLTDFSTENFVEIVIVS